MAKLEDMGHPFTFVSTGRSCNGTKASPRRAPLSLVLFLVQLLARTTCSETPFTFVFKSESRSWSEARSDCRFAGGDLARIYSDAENMAAYALTGGANTWLGLTDAQTEGTWVWADGSPLDFVPSVGVVVMAAVGVKRQLGAVLEA